LAGHEGLDYERVEFSEVYHSATQGPHNPVQAVMCDEDELRKTLAGIAFVSVDFTKEIPIGVALGDRPTSRYDVRITSVMYLTDRLKNRPPLTIVTYTDQEKGGPFDQQYRPIHIVSTRRLEGDVEFERNRAG